MPKYKNLLGQTFGRLTVISMREERSKFGAVVWECSCSCGGTSNVTTNGLVCGHTQSCGCYNKDRTKEVHAGNTYARLKYGRNAINQLYSRYKRDAAKRNLAFELSKDEFQLLTSGCCFYCGVPPSSVVSIKNAFGEYAYNGIDRVANHIGYVKNNCVSCCRACNSAKSAVTVEMIVAMHDFLFPRQIAPSPLIFSGVVRV